MDNLLAELPDPDLDLSEEDTRALVDDPLADGSHPVTTRKAIAASATCIHAFACLIIIKTSPPFGISQIPAISE